MSTMTFSITRYVSLYKIHQYEILHLSWNELKAFFTPHLRILDKTKAPGFGPYALTEPQPACAAKHKNADIVTTPHRCDTCVNAMSCAVYDVDTGTYAEVDACAQALSGTAHIWYSSFSFNPAAPIPTLRLVVPLAAPVPVAFWPSFRRNLAARFKVPHEAKACSGVSHFYFLPSCPPGASPFYEANDGEILNPAIIPAAPVKLVTARPLVDRVYDATSYDLNEVRRRLANKANGLLRSKGKDSQTKGRLLLDVLEGRPLANHGARNTSTHRAVGMVAFTAPELSPQAITHLFSKSLDAMRHEGSSLTPEQVERMANAAVVAKAQADARNAEMDEFLRRHVNANRACPPRLDTDVLL